MKILSTQKTSPENSVGWWTEEDLAEKETDSITESFLSDDTAHNYAIRDLLKLNFSDYCLSHPVPEFKLKTLHAMISCKTGKLGYNLIHCRQCGKMEMRSCSCGNRNCPSCGYLEEKRWTAMRQAEVIPGIPYFHLVFTLPHSLADIMYQNQKHTLNLLFSAAKETILELSMKKLKMTPGILMILHSFGSDLSLHYHLHVLVSGGGLTKDKTCFKRCLSNQFFLPLKAVTKVYRGKFMAGLKELHDDEKLQYFHAAQKYRNSYEWKDLLNACYNTTWNIEIKPLAPVKKSGGKTDEKETTDNAVSYFARYTNRTAISNSRILSYDKERVTFRYKDYHGSSYTMKEMTISTEEFIRRFLMHLLPAGFCRVRSAGFLAGCVRKKSLELIYTLLNKIYEPSEVKSMSEAELILHFFEKDVSICTDCGSKVEILPRMSRRSAALYIRGMPVLE